MRYNFKYQKYVFNDMFSLAFWYVFFVFFLWKKIVFEKFTTSRNVSRIFFGCLRIQFYIPAYLLPGENL